MKFKLKLTSLALGLAATFVTAIPSQSAGLGSGFMRANPNITHNTASPWALSEPTLLKSGDTELEWLLPGVISNTGVSSGDTVSFWDTASNGVVVSKGSDLKYGKGWVNYGYVPNNDENGFLLGWLKPGLLDSKGNSSGDTIAIWTLDSTGEVVTKGKPYFRGKGWQINEAYLNSDGTITTLWITTADATPTDRRDSISFSQFDAHGNHIADSAVYSKGKEWQSYIFKPFADHTKYVVYWSKTVYSATTTQFSVPSGSIWQVDETGKTIFTGPEFTHGDGYSLLEYPLTPSLDSSNNSRVLWEKDSTSTTVAPTIAIWNADDKGNVIAKSADVKGPASTFFGFDDLSAAGNVTVTWLDRNYKFVIPWVFAPNLGIKARGKTISSSDGFAPSFFFSAPDSTLRLDRFNSTSEELWSFDSNANLKSKGKAYNNSTTFYHFVNYFDPSSNLIEWYQLNNQAYYDTLDGTGKKIFTSPVYVKS